MFISEDTAKDVVKTSSYDECCATRLTCLGVVVCHMGVTLWPRLPPARRHRACHVQHSVWGLQEKFVRLEETASVARMTTTAVGRNNENWFGARPSAYIRHGPLTLHLWDSWQKLSTRPMEGEDTTLAWKVLVMKLREIGARRSASELARRGDLEKGSADSKHERVT